MIVVVDPEAGREWNESVDWYEERGKGLGSRFNAAVWRAIDSLKTQPDRFPLSGRLTRKAKIQGWPYSVFFTANSVQQRITIIAVWHGKRNPVELRRRLK